MTSEIIFKVYPLFLKFKEWLVINGNTRRVKYVDGTVRFLQSLPGVLPASPVFDKGAAHYPILPV